MKKMKALALVIGFYWSIIKSLPNKKVISQLRPVLLQVFAFNEPDSLMLQVKL